MNAAINWGQPQREVQRSAPVETVVLPLDGSEASKVALPVARTLAQIEGASLHVVYVGDQLLGPRQTLEELGLSPQELRGVVLEQLTGDPAESILQFASSRPASLIVMCTHAGGQRARASLGTVARAVVNAGPERIMLVPPDRGHQPWQVRRVLLAHSGTPSSDVAIAPAAEFAHRAGAEVIALHVASRRGPGVVEPGSLPAPRYIDQPQHEWPAWANEFLDRMMAIGASPQAVNFKLLVTGGQPGSEVAQFARDHQIDLVVLAWSGRWEAQRPGAVKVIVRRAGCPVLLVRANLQ